LFSERRSPLLSFTTKHGKPVAKLIPIHTDD
jgi:hypothetical protein